MRLCVLSALFLSALLEACSSSSTEAQSCSLGSECASGVCNADGTCAASESGSGGASASSTGAGTGGSLACSPNHDGMVVRAEVPLEAGLHATFRAAQNVMVDTAGQKQGDGTRSWDLDVALSGDHGELVETLSLEGQWFAADYAGASYAARLSDAQPLLGVFERSAAGLLLRGIVSPAGGPTRTELTYDPPVKVLAFPMQSGSTWSTTSSVSGQASGIVAFYTEAYASTVDASGTLKTPFGSFPVLRVRTNLTRTVGALVTTSHSFAFVAECFGTVASVTSQSYEPLDDFTNAAEVTRLAP